MNTRMILTRRVFASVVAVASLVVICALAASAESRGASPAISASLFDAESPLHVVDEPESAALFDQSLLPTAYTTVYREFRESRHLKIAYPEDGASFPLNIGPPVIRWEDRTSNSWRLTITPPGDAGEIVVTTDEKSWGPTADQWQAIKDASVGQMVELEIRGAAVQNGARDGDVYVDKVSFRISEHRADPIIAYRLVTPLFHGYKTPDVYYQHIGTCDKQLMYPGDGKFCANCHSFPGAPDVSQDDFNLGIVIRQRLGGPNYVILGLYNLEDKSGLSISANTYFMSWHPQGQLLAVVAGENSYSKPLITLETQEFLVLKADIHIYNTKGESAALPGASTVEYMETFPAWSADGKTVLFTRAPEMGTKWKPIRFDIYQVPYNDGKGGEAVPYPGASHNGQSNFFPRFSPDGKWMVWTKADWSSLAAPSSDLWIVGTEEGSQPRKLECNKPYSMDSHHSWSSDSRWLLFTTKRDNGIFAKICITEIDENGNASPAVELPSDEDNFMMCYNVPEFMKYDMNVDAEDVLYVTTGISRGE